jgi:hypothetical protein
MQLRLAYAGDTGMVVSWNTFSQLSRPTVRYGLSPHDLRETAWSTVSVTYPTSTTYNNHVQLKDLKPDTLYYYQPEFSNSTTPYTFRTSRPAGDGTPYSIAVVVDLGTMGPDGLTTHVGKGAANPLRVNEINTIQSLSQFKSGYDFLWHPGDIAYADYWLKEEIQDFLPNTTIAEGAVVYERILNEFYDEMTTVTTDRPYMVGPGYKVITKQTATTVGRLTRSIISRTTSRSACRGKLTSLATAIISACRHLSQQGLVIYGIPLTTGWSITFR